MILGNSAMCTWFYSKECNQEFYFCSFHLFSSFSGKIYQFHTGVDYFALILKKKNQIVLSDKSLCFI